MMQCRTSITTFASLLLVLQAAVADPVRIGKTYAIQEEDALVEIERRAATVDLQAKSRDEVKQWALSQSVHLENATVDRRYRIDMSYTLETDVPNAQGEIVYPRGYTFNPLEYMQLPYRIGVIGDGKAQLEWARKQGEGVLWLASDADPWALATELGQPVYLYTPEVAKRLKVQAVPAILEQQGSELWAQETAQKDNDDD